MWQCHGLERVGLTIPDLTPVPFHSCHFLVIQDVLFCPPGDLDLGPFFLEFVEETFPNRLAVLLCKFRIVDDDVDAGGERIVKTFPPDSW